MLKNAYFFKKKKKKKTVKIASASGASPPNPIVVTPAYYYKFIKLFLSLNAGYYPTNKRKIVAVNVLFASFILLHLFFTSNSIFYVDGGCKIFLALGSRVP